MSDLKIHSRKAEAGVSLIDVCIALILISVITVPMIQQYHQYLWKKEAGINSENLDAVNNGIKRFYLANGRYPCPALPNIPATNASYGKENCTGAGVVLTGAVPFIDLSLPFLQTIDAYNNKLIYVVTRTQTVKPVAPNPFPAGAITLTSYDQNGAPTTILLDDSGHPINAHYMVFSAGRNGAGAFNLNNALVAPCNPDATDGESENCDGDQNFNGALSSTSKANTTNAQKLRFNDDVFGAWATSVPSDIWMNSQIDKKNIYSNLDTLGVGTTTPEAALDVNGNILTDSAQSKTIVVRMCGEDMSDPNCFSPSLIATGSADGCGNAGMRGIQQDQLKCNTLQTAVPSTCTDPTYYPYGFDATGALLCSNSW